MQILNFESERFKLRTISPKDCSKKYLNWVINEKYIDYGNKNKNKLTIKILKQNILKKKILIFLQFVIKKIITLGILSLSILTRKKIYFI